MATYSPTTRRTAIASLAGATLTALASSAPAAASEPFAPVPTRLGRKYLHHVGLIRFLWEHMPLDGTQSYDACQDRVEHHHAELDKLRGEILARPVQSVSDMVDRLILLGHEVHWVDDDFQERMAPALAGALAAAGLTLEECCDLVDA